MDKLLVTGGAGFIGSHLVDELVARGARVRILDSLDPQVHGEDREAPRYLNPSAELVRGDVRDRAVLTRCLEDVGVVFHLAAAVGVGQSMYEVERYVGTNTLGTAVLLDILANDRGSVRKLIVASSMSIYGEGGYRCPNCGIVEPGERSEARLRNRQWDPSCPQCAATLIPIATAEGKPPRSTSIYALSKRDQEEMSLCVGKAYGLPTVALRFFNVYGPRQALSNPYTGAAAIFSSRALNGKSPLVYEDGSQMRDFVHVSDVVQGLLIAMERDEASYRTFNVGTGRPLAILDLARMICELVGPPGLAPEVTGGFRKGDVRHCFADISGLASLGYAPRVRFEDGLRELTEWVRLQGAEDRLELAAAELRRRGLAE